jgi:basic amino acid/polyamine antiporter, APA family
MSQQDHKHKIGLSTAIAVCLNAMIGSGIFTAPAAIASYAGPAGILAFIFVGIAVWCLALSFARLAFLYPEPGSFYTYTKAWAGHTWGIIASISYIIGLVGSMSMLTHVCSFYLSELMPSIDLRLLGLSVIALLTIFNLLGMVLSEVGQKILLFCTLFPLFTVIGVCLGNMQPIHSITFAPHGFSHILEVTRIVIFGFFGFECASSLFGIVDNPKKNVPLALSNSVLIVTCIYALFVGSLLLAVPLSLLSNPTIPLSTILANVLPQYRWLTWCIHFSILSAIIGTLHSMIWSASVFIHSFVHRIECIHIILERHSHVMQYKIIVILLGTVIGTVFLLFNNLDLFFSFAALCIVSSLCLSVIALLFLKDEWTSGRNIITLLALTTASVILFFGGQGVIDVLLR